MKTMLRSLMLVSALAVPAFAAKTPPAKPAATKTDKPATATKGTKTAHHKKGSKAADAPKTDQPAPAADGK